MTEILPPTLENPDAIAIVSEQGSITWRELERNARRVANALRADGIGVGDRWALLSGNRLEWPELFLGNVLAGSRYVPLNWHLTVPELVYLIENSQASLLVVDVANEEKGRRAATEAGITPDRIIVVGGDYPTWRDAHDDAPLDNEISGSALLYTGGTTGPSKGVQRADAGVPISQWVKGSAMWGSFVNMPDRGVCLLATPLYHAFGTGVMQACFARHHRMVIRDRFDTVTFFDDVETHRITSVPLVPTLMVRLAKLDEAAFEVRDISSLSWIAHTAAPCPAWAKQRLIDLLGPIITEFYGSSEGTGPVVCSSQDWMDRPGTVGKPNPNLQVSVVGDDLKDLPPFEIGTLYFRRADGAPSYHGDPDKTNDSRLADGRFTVGDLGYLDDDGYMFLVDRRVDLILSGGVNVYPAEIEGVISEHPAVKDVAVFGVPDDEFGQQVKAAVELEPGASLSESELIAWCAPRLASFKRPRSVDFHDALPREAHGKLKKRFLRDAYWPEKT